jgi:hypothetical protein
VNELICGGRRWDRPKDMSWTFGYSSQLSNLQIHPKRIISSLQKGKIIKQVNIHEDGINDDKTSL